MDSLYPDACVGPELWDRLCYSRCYSCYYLNWQPNCDRQACDVVDFLDFKVFVGGEPVVDQDVNCTEKGESDDSEGHNQVPVKGVLAPLDGCK